MGRNYTQAQIKLVITGHWGPDIRGEWYLDTGGIGKATKYTRRDQDKINFCLGSSENEPDLLIAAAKAEQVLCPDHEVEDLLSVAKLIDDYVAKIPGMEIFLMDLMGVSGLVLDQLKLASQDPRKYQTEASMADRELARFPLRSGPLRGTIEAMKANVLKYSAVKPHRSDWLEIHGLEEEDLQIIEAQGVSWREETKGRRVIITPDHMDGKITRPGAIESLFRDVGLYCLGDAKLAFITYLPKGIIRLGSGVLERIAARYGEAVIGFKDKGDLKTALEIKRRMRELVAGGYVFGTSPEQCASGFDLAVGQKDFGRIVRLVDAQMIVPISTREVNLGSGKFKYQYIIHKPLGIAVKNDPELVHLIMWLIASPYGRGAGVYGPDALVNQKIEGKFPSLNYSETIDFGDRKLEVKIEGGKCSKRWI